MTHGGFQAGYSRSARDVWSRTVDFGCHSQHLRGSTGVQPASGVTTFLFTDIEGSTRLWEQEPERMRPALARHDAIAKAAVARHRGAVVKITGDGIHAAFDD